MHWLWKTDDFLKLCKLCEATVKCLSEAAKTDRIQKVENKNSKQLLKVCSRWLICSNIFPCCFGLVCPAGNPKVRRPIGRIKSALLMLKGNPYLCRGCAFNLWPKYKDFLDLNSFWVEMCPYTIWAGSLLYPRKTQLPKVPFCLGDSLKDRGVTRASHWSDLLPLSLGNNPVIVVRLETFDRISKRRWASGYWSRCCCSRRCCYCIVVLYSSTV